MSADERHLRLAVEGDKLVLSAKWHWELGADADQVRELLDDRWGLKVWFADCEFSLGHVSESPR